jgi:hypothetical protein
MQKIILSCVLLSFPTFIYSQKSDSLSLNSKGIVNKEITKEIDPIVTDRPDQTEASATVPKGYFQIENGIKVTTSQSNTSSDLKSREYNYLNSLIKYGLTNRLDLRLVVDISQNKYIEDNSTVGKEKTYFKPVELGFKYHFFDQKKVIPSTSIIVHGLLDIASNNPSEKEFDNGLRYRFTFSNSITEKSSISYNIGQEWETFSLDPSLFYTFSYGHSFNKKLACFLELYGSKVKGDKWLHNFDGGITYQTNPNLQWDISYGKDLSKLFNENFISIGLSWRFPTKK